MKFHLKLLETYKIGAQNVQIIKLCHLEKYFLILKGCKSPQKGLLFRIFTLDRYYTSFIEKVFLIHIFT